MRGELAWILFGQFLGFAGGFIGIKALTNLLGPEAYGQLALGITISGVLTLLVYSPVANVVMRYFSVCQERGQLGLYFLLLRQSHGRLATLFLGAVVMAGALTWLLAGAQWGMVVVLSTLFGIVSGVNASFVALQSAIRQRMIVALHHGADVWLRIGLAIAFVYLFGRTGLSALLGYLIGTFLVTLSQRRYALRNPEIRSHWRAEARDPGEEGKVFREFSSYAGSFMLFAGFAAVSMYADRWIIQFHSGERGVGIYFAICQIASSPVNILFAMINQLMVPIIYERAGAMNTSSQAEKSAGTLRLTVLVSGAASLLICLLLFLFSEPLVRLLTNREFARYHQLLWIAAAGQVVFQMAQVMTIKGCYCNKPMIYFPPKVLQAASFVLMALCLVSTLDIYGVALAVLASSFLYLLTVMLANRSLAT
jgi:O-antigen/teichoic acid export membrane protein